MFHCHNEVVNLLELMLPPTPNIWTLRIRPSPLYMSYNGTVLLLLCAILYQCKSCSVELHSVILLYNVCHFNNSIRWSIVLTEDLICKAVCFPQVIMRVQWTLWEWLSHWSSSQWLLVQSPARYSSSLCRTASMVLMNKLPWLSK